MASKEALVIILDIGQSMGLLSNDGNMTKLDGAKTAFRLMIQQKLLFGGKQDVVGVLLFNSTKTNNQCHDEYDGYESIEEYFPLKTPNLDLLECIDNVQCNKNGKNGDALDALLVGAQIIINFVNKKKYKKRIFMITDGLSPINDTEQMEQICQSFIDKDIIFNCIGIGFNENIDLINNNNKNEKIIKEFSNKVNGNVINGESAISMMSKLRSKSVLLRPTFTGNFEITSLISIPIKLFCRCREQTLPSLKKESLIGQETKKISMDRLYKNKFRKNDDDEEVEEDERVKSYLYGKERIPFNENDELRLNFKSGEKHFKCLGFIDKSKIKRQWFMGPTFVILSSDINKSLFLSIFIQTCKKKEVYPLCRLVSRKNSSPKFVILQPRIKTFKHLFIVNELPFFEDIRKFPFASFKIKKEYVATKKHIEKCKNLIKSLNIFDNLENDKIEQLKPQQTFNPILQRFYQNLQNRALDSQSKLQELDPLILKYLEPDPILFNNQNTKKCIKEFEQIFPTKIIPKKEVKKERKHWNDINDELDNIFGDIIVDNDDNKNKEENKEEQEEEEQELDIDSLIKVDEINKIGTINPCSDFDYLLNKKTSPDLFEKLQKELWNVINNLISDTFIGIDFDEINRYEKPIKCIKHLRKHSIKEEDFKMFNEYFNKFKIKYIEKKKDLWNIIIKQNITIISNEDIDSCHITKQEAIQFLKKEIEDNQENNINQNDSDDDDMDDLV